MSTLSTLPQAPFINTLKAAPKAFHYPTHWFDKLIETYGDSVEIRTIMGGNMILTRNPVWIRKILQSKHGLYTKSELQTKHLASALGNGLLTAEGDYWLKQRRLIQPGFHKKRIQNLAALVDDEISIYIRELKKDFGTQASMKLDLSSTMMRLTFRIVSRALFKAAISDEEIDQIEAAVSSQQEFLMHTVRRPWLKLTYAINGKRAHARKTIQQMDDILLRLIKERQQEHLAGNISPEGDLLDMLLEARYEDGSAMNLKQLRDEVLILFVAGHETTANALSWIFWLLSENPSAKKKLEEEIISINYDKLDLDTLMGFPYSRLVVQEGMRLFPPAWAVDRVSLEALDLEDVRLEKGSIFILYIYGAHRHPEIWDQADQFIPERFSPENLSKEQKDAYFPFGAGQRMCIGNHFAMMEMQMVLIEFIKAFDFKALNPNQDIEALITLKPRDSMPMEIWNK